MSTRRPPARSRFRLAGREGGLQDAFYSADTRAVLNAGGPGSHPRLTTPRFFHPPAALQARECAPWLRSPVARTAKGNQARRQAFEDEVEDDDPHPSKAF